MRRLALLLLVVAAAGGQAGCGTGGGESQHVGLLVTEGFGRVRDGPEATVEVGAKETAVGLLEAAHVVAVRSGVVRSVDGRGGGPTGWSLFVNGIRPADAAPDVRLHRGDHVWWDRHDVRGARDVHAVVGAFPEPFVHGEDGRRYPIRLECADDAQAACDVATERLTGAGIEVIARSRLGTTGGAETLRILVGMWPQLRADFAAQRLEDGPRASGVFARPTADGRAFALLDGRGRPVRRVAPGTGLVAATRGNDLAAAPVWLVTAGDQAGLRQAAAALSEDALRDAFAVAVRDGRATRLPVAP